MPQPVWVLSVDLQTKTATFTSGLADAAKSARGSFEDIKSGAADMGSGVGYSTTEARHSVMLLGEEFGIHLPRALTSFIASLGPIGAAMETAFPFLAIVVGATLLLEHLAKLREEGAKLTESQVNFGTTVQNVLNGLNDKLLQAGIRTDELNHNHLGALNKQLELIDRQSMNELVQSFGVVAKAADVTFAQLKTSWYQWGAGSAGAKNALEQFKTQYDSLLAQGKDKEANDLLAGTRQSAERVLEMQKQIRGPQEFTDNQGNKHLETYKTDLATVELQKQKVGWTDKEVEAQETLVGALKAQADVQAKVNELKAAQSNNAKQTTTNQMSGDADKAARDQAASQRREAEEAQKLWEENYRTAVSNLQENERQKIDATKQGSAARLAAIDQAIKEENARGLQETSFYKSMLTARVELVRQMAQEQTKVQAEAAKQDAEHAEKMGELRLAAQRTQGQLSLSALMNDSHARQALEMQAASQDYALKVTAGQMEIAALDKTDKDYENKVRAIQNKQLELERAFQNQLTQIKVSAEEQRNQRIISAEHRMDDDLARSISGVLMRHQTFAKMMVQFGDQVVGGMMQTAIKSILTNDMTKESDAAAAARKAYLAMVNIPYVGPVLGAAAAATAFTSLMAFQEGGIVPGVGTGDIVPAKLEPGEGVLTKKVMEGLAYQSKFGKQSNDAGDIHIHHHMTNHIHAIDGASVKGMLDKHGDQFIQHTTNHLRKLNRG